jgi:hypothetical protein
MCASVVTGQYGRVQQLLSLSSLQEWLTFRLAQIVHAFGDAMQVVEAPCPRCRTLRRAPCSGLVLRCMPHPRAPSLLEYIPPEASVVMSRTYRHRFVLSATVTGHTGRA